MSTTMTAIAQEVGVSVAVVSRLLRDDPTLRISDNRRRQILETTERLGGVKVRRPARRRTPRKPRTRTILIPTNRVFTPQWILSNLANNPLFKALEAALGRERFHLHHGFFGEGEEAQYLRSVIQRGAYCDGLYIPTGILNAELAQLLRESRFPHVTNDHCAERLSVNTVRPHFSEGIRQAVEHLQSLGHRHIGMFGGENSYRFPMVAAALASQGIAYNLDRHRVRMDNLMPGEDFEQLRVIAARDFGRWLSETPQTDLTAIVCDNDLIVMGAMDAMRAHGLVPGRDLSLVGVDNLEQRNGNPVSEPVITTIDNPKDIVGRRMGELLLNQIMHGQNQIVHERIPAPLIVRQTTGPAPARKG